MMVKNKSEKSSLKLNIKKNKTWKIEGKKVGTVTDFIFLDSKITVDRDWSHETERCLLLGRKSMTNPDSVLKSRNITLLKKVC